LRRLEELGGREIESLLGKDGRFVDKKELVHGL
jgi:hypothetical protein